MHTCIQRSMHACTHSLNLWCRRTDSRPSQSLLTHAYMHTQMHLVRTHSPNLCCCLTDSRHTHSILTFIHAHKYLRIHVHIQLTCAVARPTHSLLTEPRDHLLILTIFHTTHVYYAHMNTAYPTSTNLCSSQTDSRPTHSLLTESRDHLFILTIFRLNI
jgi:hypothetical protein